MAFDHHYGLMSGHTVCLANGDMKCYLTIHSYRHFLYCLDSRKSLVNMMV